jgi:hypothetical protein
VSHTVNKRDFYRTTIGPTEKAIGGLILILLIVIGFGIARKGQDFDQTRYTGDVEALEFTRSAVEGKAATLRNEVDLRENETYASQNAEPTGPARQILPLADGLVPLDGTEYYTEDTLYEKINGRAPAYFEYGFQELTSRSFALEGNDGEYVDIYLFKMDSPLNAFGIFSSERDESGLPLDWVADGYSGGMGIFMRYGSVYVQILASSTNPSVMRSAEAFARGLIQILPEDDSGMQGRSMLPSDAQVPGSLTYINNNAYGQAVLNDVFEARYQINGGELTTFAQHCADVETARANWETLREFYSQYGNLENTFQAGGADGFVAEIFGQWSAILTRDNAVVGVVNAAERDSAVEFVMAQLTTNPETAEEDDDYAY